MELPHLSGAEVRKIILLLIPMLALAVSACGAASTTESKISRIPTTIGDTQYTLTVDEKTGEESIIAAFINANMNGIMRFLNIGDFLAALQKLKGILLNEQECAAAIQKFWRNTYNFLPTATPDFKLKKQIFASDTVLKDIHDPLFIPPGKACHSLKPTATSTATATQTATRTSTPTPTKLVSPLLRPKYFLKLQG